MAEEVTAGRPLRVAIVGSGPAGVYAAQALLRERPDVHIDVLDRLPTPYGLVRYGVAPDHPKIKSIARALRRVLESPQVRFLGNVAYGTDVRADDLRSHYDAVVHATGAAEHRRLGVPGEELVGSAAAADFVSWYNGDPFGPAEFALDAESVAVVGAGNVALDAARMLVTPPAELSATDVPDEVLAAYQKCRATDVYLFCRRGPQHTKFTTPELRELADLPDVDVLVSPDELPDEAADDDYDRTTRNNVATMRDWAARPSTGAARRIRLCFWRRPTRILGTTDVEALQVEHTALADDGRLTGTGDYDTVPVGAVLRAVGYVGAAPPGLPFDTAHGTVRHRAGRIVDADGHAVPGLYAAGWIKRGAVGVIGTNKADAAETVHTLLADLADGSLPTATETPPDLTALLAARGVAYTTWQGWCTLEEHETERGRQQNRPAAKVAGLAEMLDLAANPPRTDRDTPHHGQP